MYMPTLPFMVLRLDLICTSGIPAYMLHIQLYFEFKTGYPFLSQVKLINNTINSSCEGTSLLKLHNLSHPSIKIMIVEVLIQCIEWSLKTRHSNILESELPEVHQDADDLLELQK